MPKLAIVTYLRGRERLTPELIEIGNALQQHYPDLIMELYVDSLAQAHAQNADFTIHVNYLQGTKFLKLLNSLTRSDSDYLLSLDNDIAANLGGLLRLVDQTIVGEYDLGWGLVLSHRVSNFISRLVEIDKLFSHTLLRPALWRLRLGITIPGQCFLLKTKSFRNSLPSTDTFLDDLSIGLHAVRTRLHYHYAREVVAFELPSYTFMALWKQRARWAAGFNQCLSCDNLEEGDRRLLWIHAFFYHMLPILQVVALVALIPLAPLVCVGWLAMMSALTVRDRPSAIGMAFLYFLLFPAFHLGWWYHYLRANL